MIHGGPLNGLPLAGKPGPELVGNDLRVPGGIDAHVLDTGQGSRNSGFASCLDYRKHHHAPAARMIVQEGLELELTPAGA